MQQYFDAASGNNSVLNDLLHQVDADIEKFFDIWLKREKSVAQDKISALKFAFLKMFYPIEFYNNENSNFREMVANNNDAQFNFLYGQYYAAKLTPNKVTSMINIPRVSKYFSNVQKQELLNVKQRVCQNFETLRGYTKYERFDQLRSNFFETIEKDKLGGYGIY